MVRQVLVASAIVVVLGFSAVTPGLAQTSLPPAVQADLLRVRIDTALKSGDGPGAVRLLDEMVALAPGLPPGEMPLLEARVALAVDDFVRAERTLTAFLSGADRNLPSYAAALEVLATLEQRRSTRLRVMRTDARIAESSNDFALSESLLTAILAQVDRTDPLYAETLTLLAEMPARKAAAEQARADKQAAAQRAAEITEQRLAAAEVERDLYLSPGFDPAVVLKLRWTLNKQYGKSIWQVPERADFMTEGERDLLVQFRRENNLHDGQPDALLRYLDASVYAAARDLTFTPLRPDYSFATRAEASGDWWSTTIGEPSDPDFMCDALTVAAAMEPVPDYAYPVLRFQVSPGQTNGQIKFLRPSFDVASQVEVRIDGRTIPSGSKPGWISLDGQGTLTRAMRAGGVMTATGISEQSGQKVTHTFSLKGFTRAFERMTQICQRPDAMVWLR